MDRFDYIVLTLSFFSIVVMSLLFSLEFEVLKITGYYVSGTEDVTILAIVVLFIIGLIYAEMIRYLRITKELMEGPREQRSVELLELSFEYILFTTVGMIIAYIWYLSSGYSGAYIDILGLKVYLYPVLAGFGTIASFAALIYSAMFAINEFHSIMTKGREIIGLVVFVIFWIFAILPYNYYALYPPTNGLYTRWIVFVLHVFFGILVAIFAGYTIFKKATLIGNTKQKTRLKLIGFGFTIYPLIFLPPILGVLVFKGTPMLVWYTLSYVVLLIASVLIYLGYVTPSWLEERI